MNMPKITKNILHFAVIVATAYLATHPDSEWIWIMPGVTWLGQALDPPDVTPGPPNG